jgi:glycosyltransferase involved in cell wall biosynthesis
MKRFSALTVVPSLETNEGCSINESELIKVLGEKVSKLYVVSFVSAHKYFMRISKQKSMAHEYNATVILLPTFSLPFVSIFSYMTLISVYLDSLAALLIAFLLKFTGHIDFVYIRDPRFAITFIPFKRRFRVLAIKYAGFYVQEILRLPKIVGSMLERMNSICVGAANPLVVHSELYESILRKWYQYPLSRVVVLPPGVRIKEITACKKLDPQYASNHMVNVDAFKVGFIGSTAWWNGADALIQAIGAITAKSHSVVLFVAGLADRKSLQSMMEMCEELKIKAVFLGLLTHQEALHLMSKMDVIVVPRQRTMSTETTIPIRIAEAFALGTPVIVTRHRIFEMKYIDCKDVIYCEPDPESIAEKITMLMNNPSLASKLSEQGRINAKEFDYDVLVSQLINGLSKIHMAENQSLSITKV